MLASCRPRPCSSLGTVALDKGRAFTDNGLTNFYGSLGLGGGHGPVYHQHDCTTVRKVAAALSAHPKSASEQAPREGKMPTLTRVSWLLVLGGRPDELI